MKKLFTVLIAGAITSVASANLVKWQYVGVAADKDAAVYLYVGSNAPTKFESLAQLEAASLSTGAYIQESVNGRTGAKAYTSTGSVSRDWSVGDSYYLVLVSSDGASYFIDSTRNTVSSSNIYNEGETAGTTLNTYYTSAAHEYTEFAPEPTSGILLLVGGALLGLRRKRA